MPDLQHPPAKLTLYTCHVGRGGPSFLPHGCRQAHEALDEAGISYESVVFGKGRPLAIGTTGKRPELKRISGQEKSSHTLGQCARGGNGRVPQRSQHCK